MIVTDVYCSYTNKYMGTKFICSAVGEHLVSHSLTYLAARELLVRSGVGMGFDIPLDSPLGNGGVAKSWLGSYNLNFPPPSPSCYGVKE